MKEPNPDGRDKKRGKRDRILSSCQLNNNPSPSPAGDLVCLYIRCHRRLLAVSPSPPCWSCLAPVSDWSKGDTEFRAPLSPSATPSARKPSQLSRGLISWCWIYDIKPRAPCPENTDPRAPEIQRPVGRVRMQRSDARAQRRMGARVRG